MPINKQIANRLIKALTVAKHYKFRDLISIANLKKHLKTQVVPDDVNKLVDMLEDLILSREANIGT
jgi:hypothetical protein